MTIVHIINSIAGGGAEEMVYQLAKRSDAQYPTKVIALSNKNTLEHKFKAHNIELHYLDINSFKNKSLLKGLKSLNQILNKDDDMVIHCHQYYAGLLGIYYKLFFNFKVDLIFTLHTNKLDAVIRRLVLFLTKPLRSFDIVFSSNSKKWYLKNNAIIPNGVDFNALKSANNKRTFNKETAFELLFLGRLNEAKNPLFLITLAKQLLDHHITNFNFQIVGDGELKASFLQQINEAQLERHFNFHGFQNEVKPYLNRCHCLVLPSIREGMPMVILEAGATRLPIIATPVGSIPDFLNEQNAYLASLNDFHKAVSQVYNDYAEALKRSDQLLHDLEEKFNIENVYKQHINLYHT